ncbi:hypothetical protein [Amycolatopsis thermophila]|uniref:Uncharacterized protein n=1 Tax=Amycolatopsis thermophila TaxID=206084 RepID=A0ABU0EMW7_9PSEU|nr:hypothetical protein [Amycolatopsis thermophila]MDQ0376577.1 hypothetical protein [Amycolatopsis thermophila]
MHPTVAQNNQHRHDLQTGAWVRKDRNTYENYEGYQIRREGRGWAVYLPGGERLTNKYFIEPTLTFAKYEADKHRNSHA